MVDYNFSTEDGLNYQNLPFDLDNYTSNLCIIPQLQAQMERAERVEQAFYVLAFFLAIDVIFNIIRYLKTRRLD